MPKPHVVIISQIPLWSMGKAVGGPAFENTISALGRRYRVSLVTPRLGYVDPEDLPEGVELHQFTHRLHGLWRSVRKLGWVTDTLAWYTFRAAAWRIVKRLCATGDVDLVYGYEIYGVPVARRASRRFGLPIVARYQGTLMYRRREERLATLRYWKHVAALRTPADLYIMTNDGTLGDVVLRDLGHDPDRIRFWMNGVSRDILAFPTRDMRSELGIARDRVVLLTVSRLAFWKRIDRVIEVTGLLVERGLPIELIIAGQGPDEQMLRTQVLDSGLENHIHFVGGVTRQDLPSYFRSATLFLSLNDYTNLVNPVYEAMVLGIPLAALDTGGTATVVQDGVNGILLPEVIPAELADRVEVALSDPAELSRLGDRAAAWAETGLWEWDRRMQAEATELDRLIQQRSEGGAASP